MSKHTIWKETTSSQPQAAGTFLRVESFHTAGGNKAGKSQTLPLASVGGRRNSFSHHVIKPKGAFAGHTSKEPGHLSMKLSCSISQASDDDEFDEEIEETLKIKKTNNIVNARDILIQVKPVIFSDIGNINRFQTETEDSQAVEKVNIFKNRLSGNMMSQARVTAFGQFSSPSPLANFSSSSSLPEKPLNEDTSVISASALQKTCQESQKDGCSDVSTQELRKSHSSSITKVRPFFFQPIPQSPTVSSSPSSQLKGQPSNYGAALRSMEKISSVVKKPASATNSNFTHSLTTKIRAGGNANHNDDDNIRNKNTNNLKNTTKGSENIENTESPARKKLPQGRLMTLMNQLELNSYDRYVWHDIDADEKSVQRAISPFGRRGSFFGVGSELSPSSSSNSFT